MPRRPRHRVVTVSLHEVFLSAFFTSRRLVAYSLDEIPSANHGAKRCCRIGGTKQEGRALEIIWARSWMSEADKPLTREGLCQQDQASSDERDIVYGVCLSGLLFFPRKRAEDFASFYEAYRKARTWGELRRLASSRILDEVADFDDEGDSLPDDTLLVDCDPITISWPFPESDQFDSSRTTLSH